MGIFRPYIALFPTKMGHIAYRLRRFSELVRSTSLSVSFVKITEIYTHVTEKHICVVRSPPDILAQAYFCGKCPEFYGRLPSPYPTKYAGSGAHPGVSFLYGGIVDRDFTPDRREKLPSGAR
jgi:hypothetical protein